MDLVIEFGNPKPTLPEGETRDAPCVTHWSINTDPDNFPENHHCYAQVEGSGLTGDQLKLHLADAIFSTEGMVTRLPGHEPVLSAIDTWRVHAKPGTTPLWVASNNPETERILAEFFRCPAGKPDDVEQTHYTSHFGVTFGPGDAPVEGVPYNSIPDIQANITQNGRDMQARMFGTGTGSTGTNTTAPTSTTITLNGAGAPGSTTAFNGQMVICNGVYGNIVSNTNVASPVVTFDRWNAFATPGASSAAATPASGVYVIPQVGAPAQIMGLSTSTTTLATPSTNTSLPSEITTAGGGLVRQICPIAHTASTNTITLTPVYTANGSDSLPVIVGSIGTFNTMVVANTTFTMFFNTVFTTTATLSAVSDQLTVTQTVSTT